MQDLDDAARIRIAQDWLQDYGEAIDCAELTDLASPRRIAEERVDLAFQMRGEEFRQLLNRQADERYQFLHAPIKGSSDSLHTLILRWAKEVQREANDPAAGASEAWSVIELSHGGDLAKLRRQAEAWRDARPRWIPSDSTRTADHPLLWAAAHIARWIRKHSRTRRNDWNRVHDCLRWHGNDIAATGVPDGSSRGESLKKRVTKISRLHERLIRKLSGTTETDRTGPKAPR